MKPPVEVLATLDARGFREIADQVAVLFSLPLVDIVDDANHAPEFVEARHALISRLRGVLPSNAAVARVLGCDPSTVGIVMHEERSIVECELARFVAPTVMYVLRWRRRPESLPPFGVATFRATAGDAPGWFENECDWHPFYPLARARFDELSRASGAPTFAGHSDPPVEREVSP